MSALHLSRLARRGALPRRTVRLRLTALYGMLFLASGAGLLAITNILARSWPWPALVVGSDRGGSGRIQPAPFPLPAWVQARAAAQHAAALNQLLAESAIALGVMAVVSVALGWLMAGRVLRPLRAMTAAARAISAEDLNQRLAVPGPDDELKDLGDTIDELLDRLETAFAAQRRFAANASHELRTPLAMMRTSLDVASAKPGPVPAELTVLAGKLREGLDQADQLVENLLLLARAQHGARDGQETISLDALITGAIGDRAGLIASMGLDVRHAPADGTGVLVTGNPVLLAQMIANLIDNAVRHNHPGSWIRTQITRDGPTVWLLVENGGPVLDPAKITTLTQPFRRLAADRTGSAAGTGLGLSITEAVAAAHGGSLHLHARPEGGLRGHRPARRCRHRAASPAGHGGRRPVRVLVAEDVRRLADDIAEGLRDQGIAADVAYDGADAAVKLDLNPYDVLVLDRDLPGIHGDTICRTIAAAGHPVMILMLTAAGAPGDRVTGLALGADDYLPKPFHFPELVLRIRALARRKPAARPRILRAAGIELDPLRRTVTRQGRSVDISVKEFAVLETLLRAAPGVLSAEDLLAQAWDENADPFTKTVQITISRLRRKLGDPPPIQTIPGAGYRITDLDQQPSP